jgi:hypothetical protein
MLGLAHGVSLFQSLGDAFVDLVYIRAFRHFVGLPTHVRKTTQSFAFIGVIEGLQFF